MENKIKKIVFIVITILIGIIILGVLSIIKLVSASKAVVDFYLINLIFCFFYLMGYIPFRDAIRQKLVRRKDLSGKGIMTLKEGGIKNYLFYKRLHQKFGLGFWYYLNYLDVFAFALYFICLILVPWLKVSVILCAVFAIFCNIFFSISWIFSVYQNNLTNFKKGIVLFAKVPNEFKHRYASILDYILCPVLYLLFCYAQVFLVRSVFA